MTWVNGQGEDVELAAWLLMAIRVLVNGALGVVLVGALVFSSYQVIDSSRPGMVLVVELAAVPFASGVIAGEIRRR